MGNLQATGLLRGALGGIVATGAMSAVMVAGDRLGLMGEQPPTKITAAALQKAGVDDPSGVAAVIAPLAHLGFGAAVGATYGLLRRIVPSVPSVPLGIGFGLAVYVTSYKGWIPALGIMPPPERDRPGRPAIMLAAHVVYGVVLGCLPPSSTRLNGSPRRTSP